MTLVKKSIQKNLEYLLKNNCLNFLQLQKGVFRTNCIDSLDRTNVVQSTFARYFLFKIFYELNLSIVKPSEDNVFQKFDGNFEPTFKFVSALCKFRINLPNLPGVKVFPNFDLPNLPLNLAFFLFSKFSLLIS